MGLRPSREGVHEHALPDHREILRRVRGVSVLSLRSAGRVCQRLSSLEGGAGVVVEEVRGGCALLRSAPRVELALLRTVIRVCPCVSRLRP